MSKKINVLILQGNKRTNEFMHSADMFETGKQLIDEEATKLMIEYADDDVSKFPAELAASLEEIGRNVVFVAIETVDGKRIPEPIVYIKPNVQTVSMGTKFALFEEVLSALGYKAKTDKRMNVLSVTY